MSLLHHLSWDWHSLCLWFLNRAHNNLIHTGRGAGSEALYVAGRIIYHTDRRKEAASKLRL